MLLKKTWFHCFISYLNRVTLYCSVPGEKRTNPPTFTIRHTANTLISHVDNGVVPHFGYLPHHMIGRSVFDFYYAEDLPYLKDVYTNGKWKNIRQILYTMVFSCTVGNMPSILGDHRKTGLLKKNTSLWITEHINFTHNEGNLLTH